MKLKRKLKIGGGIIGLILICVVGGGLYDSYYNAVIFNGKGVEYRSKGRANLERILSISEIEEDVNQVIKTIEETHPVFIYEVPEKYANAKKIFLENTKKEMTTVDFQRELSIYVASLNDGHTFIRDYVFENEFLDINWKLIDDELIVLDEEKMLTKERVKSIGGVDVKELISRVKPLLPSENYVTEIKNIENGLKGKLSLEVLGIEVGNTTKVIVESNGEDIIKEVGITNINEMNSYDRRRAYEKINDDIFYVDLGECIMDNMMREINRATKEEVEKGTKNIIIDVRDNGGGNSDAITSLLEALGAEIPWFGMELRYSPLAKEQRGYLRDSGDVFIEGKSEFKKNENINLYVISNQNTFSSAQMLVTYVRDGKLGKIVGTAGSNSPSAYGDLICFQLENSLIELGVSHKLFLRPDESRRDENVIEPDIKTKLGDDPIGNIINDIEN